MSRADFAWLCSATLASTLATAAHAVVSVGSIDMGGSGGSFGSPITSTGLIYQHPQGDSYPPPAFSLIPGIYNDSYVAIDPNGPSSLLYSASPQGDGSPAGVVFTDFTLSGGFVSSGSVVGGTTNLPDGVLSHIFFARLTIPQGHALFASNLRILLGGEGAIALQFALNGPVVTGPSGARYRVKSYLTEVSVGVAHDLYVEELEVPGPATALGAFITLFPLRRRRNVLP